MKEPYGWSADIDENNGKYQPVLNLNSGWMPHMTAWFDTELECEEFINEYLIGTGWDDGEPNVLKLCICLTKGSACGGGFCHPNCEVCN